MKGDDVKRMVEEMTTNRLRERTRQLAEQAGFVLWYGAERRYRKKQIAVDWASNYDDELEKFAELVREDEMNERIRELAIQSGLIAPYGSDHEGLRDFDYRQFAELVRADEREACADAAGIALLRCERSIRDRVVGAIKARGEAEYGRGEK